MTRARSELAGRSDLFDLTAPVEEVKAAADTAGVAGRRLLLIGGEAAALLLAFSILAAASLRRDLEAARQRLIWQGARPWQLSLFAAGELSGVAAAGTLAGWAAGIGLAAAAADRLGSPAGPVLVHSVLSGTGLGVAAGLAGASALVLLVATRAPTLRLRGLSLSALDVAALGALAAIILTLVRGRAGTGALATERGAGAVLLLLPGLVAFVAAVACARALVPVLRSLERLGRSGPVPVRLAALSLARNPGRAAVAVSFLAVSLGLGLFAETYRTTLRHGQEAEARYAVPADFVLGEDLTTLVPVLEAAPLEAYRRLGGVRPVLRLSADVARLEGGGLTLLGIPDRRLALPGSDLRGARLPAGLAELSIPVAGRGDPVLVRASIQTPRGTFVTVPLGLTPHLRGRVPREARGGLLIALSFDLPSSGLHRVPNGGTGAQPLAKGVLTLGRRLQFDPRAWVGVNGIRARGRTLRYLVTNEVESRFRARQPTDGKPVPVIVSPRIAAAAGPGGLLPVNVTGDQQLEVRIVGVRPRQPSVYGEFLLADEQTVATALNASFPGSAVPSEIWLSSRDVAATERALRQAPFDALALSSRHDLEADLRSEPLARGALLTLAGAALAALGLALAGLLLGLAADLRDEIGELADLEAQGAAPAALRRHVRLRTHTVAAFGLLGGLATGAVLSALVVDLVVLTANATTPEPPLGLHVGWALVAAAVAVYAVLAATLATLSVRLAV